MAERKPNNWMDLMQAPRSLAIKKYIAQILENKYMAYEETIERATHQLITERDMSSFGKMVADIYEAGYMRAVNDYKTQLEKMNIRVNITTQKNSDGSQ